MGRTRHIIAIDPGDTNNGFAYFKQDDSGVDLKIMKVCGPKELSDLLRVMWGLGQANMARPDFDATAKNPHSMFFVIENFRVDTHVRGKPDGAMFQWNEMFTSQMIGRVRLCAEWLEAPVFMQEPSILVQARRWSPISLPKGHIPDEKSAFLHGAHFMLTNRLIKTPEEVRMFGQETLG
jgi:hypothetical protein